jgi:NAD(P)-dependent dehydrogenase (short-subunit alcohol dehydrogenase family)
MVRARVRQSTLASLLKRGVAVEYLSADVRDERSTRDLLEKIYAETGRIDVVFHGAGIIADKLISDKTRASFDEVFDTKADSAWLLARYLRPDTLKHLVLFGSMASRFGNPGQGDYSAASEVLNGVAWHLRQRWPDCHVVCINWGPWAETGMVASAALTKKLSEQGIMPIATEAGCEFVRRELIVRTNDVEVIAGEGVWNPAQNGSPRP